MVTLEDVRAQSAPELYPRHVLVECSSALVLFAAAWHGKQDAVWIADAGLTATCVDLDADRLDEMEAAYPDGWEFVALDVFDFAVLTENQWDVVSIDCPTNLFDRCSDFLPVWCLLARRAVVLGSGEFTVVLPPAGWEITEQLRRSSFNGGVYWTVIKPC